MKDAYIKQVEKALARHISHKKRKEILRDLGEIFSSALEHGETEAQVMERLGTPETFVQNIVEQFGPTGTTLGRRRRMIFSLVTAIAAFSLLFVNGYRSVPANAIGYAEAMTRIRVEGVATDLTPVVLAVGVIAAVTAILQFVRLIREGVKER